MVARARPRDFYPGPTLTRCLHVGTPHHPSLAPAWTTGDPIRIPPFCLPPSSSPRSTHETVSCHQQSSKRIIAQPVVRLSASKKGGHLYPLPLPLLSLVILRSCILAESYTVKLIMHDGMLFMNPGPIPRYNPKKPPYRSVFVKQSMTPL